MPSSDGTPSPDGKESEEKSVSKDIFPSIPTLPNFPSKESIMENLPSIPKADFDISAPSFVKEGLDKVNETFNEANEEMKRIDREGTVLRPGLQKIREGLNESIQGVSKGKKEGEKQLMEKIHIFEDIWMHSDKIFSDFNVIRKTYPEATALGAFTFTSLFVGGRGKVGLIRRLFMGSLVVGSSAAYFNYYDRKVLKQLKGKTEEKK